MSFYIKDKGWFEESGAPIGSQRKVNIAIARQCGFENDTARFTRLLIESRVSGPVLREAWQAGVRMRTKGAMQ